MQHGNNPSQEFDFRARRMSLSVVRRCRWRRLRSSFVITTLRRLENLMLPAFRGLGFRAVVLGVAWGAAVALASADERDTAAELEAAFRKGLALRDMGRNDE